MSDEDLPDFDRFDIDDAWRVGSALVEHCRAERLPVVVSITLGEQRVFHVALPGATADNDAWAERKANVVRRFDRSSKAVAEHYRVDSWPEFYETFALARTRFAVGEGAVPLRVHGAQVGVLAISGLETGGDHDLAVLGLRLPHGAGRR
ncbi:heme-degrading domain-containing protein [Amnibacterium soli]|uniref:Heme-degrading domain-containing protein n=1 Tax=Amnibacterium soli TaxID=1282736 RepID=A0ABP8YRP9_9MICO